MTEVLELTINPAYVPDWDVLEGLRELIQNALDAQDQGFDMFLAYTSDTQVLSITNTGAQLRRSSLLLGTSDKDGQTARGHFGEGYKLACLALLRAGCVVTIRTGTEVWKPKIAHSAHFGTHTLQIEITAAAHEPGVCITVDNISSVTWDAVQQRVLILTPPPPDRVIMVGNDCILLEAHRRNMLFVRDLWVTALPDNYRFGYALHDVTLDRDRRLADPWALRKAIKQVLLRAVQSGDLRDDTLYDVLLDDCGEARAIEQEYLWSNPDALTAAITAQFARQYGEDAVPVSSMSESLIAAQHGLKGVTVPRAVRRVVETQLGSFEDRKSRQQLVVAKTYNAHELTIDEQLNFARALALVTKAEPACDPTCVNVVDFLGSDICGMYHSGKVYVAKRMLIDRDELLATLVHEFCHSCGPDGSVPHTRAMEKLFARIITGAGVWA